MGIAQAGQVLQLVLDALGVLGFLGTAGVMFYVYRRQAKTGQLKLQQEIDKRLDEAHKDLLATQEVQIAHFREEVGTLRKSFADLQDAYTALQKSCADDMVLKEAQLKEAKTENADLRDERARLVARVAQHEMRIEDLQKEMVAVRRRTVRARDRAPYSGAERRETGQRRTTKKRLDRAIEGEVLP